MSNSISIELDDSTLQAGLKDPAPRMIREHFENWLTRRGVHAGQFRFVIRDMCRSGEVGVMFRRSTSNGPLQLKVRPTGGHACFVGELTALDEVGREAILKLRLEAEKLARPGNMRRKKRASSKPQGSDSAEMFCRDEQKVAKLREKLAQKQRFFGRADIPERLLKSVIQELADGCSDGRARRILGRLVSHGILRRRVEGGRAWYGLVEELASQELS